MTVILQPTRPVVGVQASFAQCYRGDNVAVANSYCEESEKPDPSHAVCTGRPCSPRFVSTFLWKPSKF